MARISDNSAAVMQRARERAKAGDLAGAAEICRQLVSRSGGDFYALFMLGTLESHFGNFKDAERHLSRASALNPQSPEALISRGNALLELKRPEEAAQALDKALAIQPREVNGLFYRGLAAAELEKEDDALEYFDRALRVDPRAIHALHNRASILIKTERLDEARQSVEAALRIAPGHVPAIANRATILIVEGDHVAALTEAGRGLAIEPRNAGLHALRARALTGLARYDEALAAYDKAITLAPDRAESHIGRGNLLAQMRRFGAAFEAFDTALALNHDSADVHLNRANAFMEWNRLEDALLACEKAIVAKPLYANALLLRANILVHLGRSEEAFAAYDKAIAAKPSSAETHYHRGSALLLHGRFKKGWHDFEYRWDVADRGFDRPVLEAPEWRGEPLKGRSLVVYSEQGLGDTIQFVRFLPTLERMGAKLTFLCHPNLLRLFGHLAGRMELVALCKAGRRFDFQCALMSLPERLGVGFEDVPNEVPYLFAEKPLVETWRARIGESGFRIGVTWQGNPRGKIDRGRSIPLEKLRPLAELPGLRLIALQRRHGLDQLAHLPKGMTIETLGRFDEGEDAFVDTAAIMQSLDLFVTSDTATAHLAGALGRPAWVVLKKVPDWRFMVERSDSPWYPTMRLFRQHVAGDWDSAVVDMAEVLRARMDLQRRV